MNSSTREVVTGEIRLGGERPIKGEETGIHRNVESEVWWRLSAV